MEATTRKVITRKLRASASAALKMVYVLQKPTQLWPKHQNDVIFWQIL